MASTSVVQKEPSQSSLATPAQRLKNLPPPPPSSCSSSRREPLIPKKHNHSQDATDVTSEHGLWLTTWTKNVEHWIYHAAWPGLGLFGESYILFSIGLLQPVWKILFPYCWLGVDCSPGLISSITYSVILGVILGMLVLGAAARRFGRRNGSLSTAFLMSIGSLGLTLASVLSTHNPKRLFQLTSFSLFVFGVGVGGEYPLAASSSSEAAMGEMQEHLRGNSEKADPIHSGEPDVAFDIADRTSQHEYKMEPEHSSKQLVQFNRGRKVQLVFTMQGLGIFVNALSMAILLFMMGQTGHQYDEAKLLLLWQSLYVFGTIVLLIVLLSRYLYLQESKVWLEDKRRREFLALNSAGLPGSPVSHVYSATFSMQAMTPYISSMGSPPRALSQSDQVLTSSPSVVPDIPYDRSAFSDVSSLSIPSVEFNDVGLIREVPSADDMETSRSNDWNLLLRNYGARLVGVSLSWMFWDVAFYGNKLFQSSFLLALTGEETTLFELALAASLNSFVALLGYFGAAVLLDHPKIGRCRLQIWGLLLTGCLFVGCGLFFHSLSSVVLVTMYLGSSFIGQLGPNATTFLLPVEIFPTEMRTVCHGIAAAAGKVGALIAAILFHHVSELDLFLVSGYASFAAGAITLWTIPETLGLDLHETDRKWRMILDRRKSDYDGKANHARFLSYYELYTLQSKQNGQSVGLQE